MATMTIIMPSICVRSKFLQKDKHGGAKFRLNKAKGQGMRGEMFELWTSCLFHVIHGLKVLRKAKGF
jgi:hypothetical protein